MYIYAYVCTYLHRNLRMCICAPAVTRADRSLTSTSPAMLVFFSTSVALHAAPRICGYACKGTYQDCKRPQLTPYFAHTKFGESMMCLALLCWHPLSYFLMILLPISYKSYASWATVSVLDLETKTWIRVWLLYCAPEGQLQRRSSCCIAYC